MEIAFTLESCAMEYRLLTIWRYAAPQKQVFDVIADAATWPSWWPGVDGVEELARGAADRIGAVHRYTWKGDLPYRLSFLARATRIEAPALLEAEVEGDLSGSGRWSFAYSAGVTTVRYEWRVRTTRPWMNLAAPLAGRLFVHNHHALMRRGGEALARKLDVPLVDSFYGAIPLNTAERCAGPALVVGAVAGIAAGVVATAAQMALWGMMSMPVIGMLLRDSRLAAAIVLGPGVLPPPASFDWLVMLVAGAVHVALSAAYGMMIASLPLRDRQAIAAAAGALFGLGLFAVNMYGFTLAFPWFAASRDWITAAAHIVFGVSGALLVVRLRRTAVRAEPDPRPPLASP